MTFIPQTPEGFAPFEQPVAVPIVHWDDPPLVCVQINETWMTLLIGAAFALAQRSAWDSTDDLQLQSVMQQARQLQIGLASLEACPMIEFRVNPDNNYYWDYSIDGGTTWTRQPDTVANFQINWEGDGASPSGLEASINNGQSFTVMPKPIGTDPDAVVTDPLTAIVNTIAPFTGVPGAIIKALNDVAIFLESNHISLHLFKSDERGTPDSATVMQIDKPEGYSYPLIEVPD